MQERKESSFLNQNEGLLANYQIPNVATLKHTLQVAAEQDAQDSGEGIDHYKKLFSFSKYST